MRKRHYQLSIIHYPLLKHSLLQKIREHLALLLLILLPLHALLVTVGTKLIAGPGHAPLLILALWKEGVLGLILLIAGMEILFLVSRFSFLVWPFSESNPKRTTNNEQRITKFDLPDILILSLLALAFLVPLETGNWKLVTTFAHGFRYDFVPLIAFLLLRRVPWSDRFKEILPMLLLGIGALIAAYGIVSFFLPPSFFTWLGYSDLHSLYVPDGPLAAFQQIGSTGLRRIQSTLSGPNQLGLWLLIPWSILMGCLLSFVSHTKERSKEKITANQITSGRAFVGINHYGTILNRIDLLLGSIGQRLYTPRGSRIPSMFVCVVLFSLFGISLLLTFSRAAWMGALAIVIVTLIQTVPRHLYAKIFLPLSGMIVLLAIGISLAAPSVILRLASSRDHLIRPLEAIRTMIDHPLGLGLGTAGPASNRTLDACVFLEAGSNPSWALDRPALCVFVGSQQVQPTDRICRCPFLPENWYLQIGVELGVIGFLLFILLTITVLRRTYGEMRIGVDPDSKYWLFLSFLALSLAALFLHAWEDSATAWTVWILCAIVLQSNVCRVNNTAPFPA